MKGLLAKRLGLASPADAPAKEEEVRAEEREYRQSVGFLADDARARVDQLVADARADFDDRFAAAGRIPDSWRHEFGWQIATLFVLGSDEFSRAAHAAVDRAAEAGLYDTTPRAEVEAKLAAYERQRMALRLAAEEEAVARAEAQAKVQREDFDRRAAELVNE